MIVEINTNEKTLIVKGEVPFCELKKFVKKLKLEDYKIASSNEFTYYNYPQITWNDPLQPYYTEEFTITC